MLLKLRHIRSEAQWQHIHLQLGIDARLDGNAVTKTLEQLLVYRLDFGIHNAVLVKRSTLHEIPLFIAGVKPEGLRVLIIDYKIICGQAVGKVRHQKRQYMMLRVDFGIQHTILQLRKARKLFQMAELILDRKSVV